MTPGRFGLIVFDWDGTLMDSTAAIVTSIQAACRDIGCEIPPDAAARQIIGLGLKEAIAALLPALPAASYPDLVERYRHHYLGRDATLPLFDGVIPLLDALRAGGTTLAVATGKSHLGLTRALAASGLDSYFCATRCADQCASKPHPAMLLELMAELGATPERTLMVGDTTHDLEMARQAGVAALAVSYGAHDAQTLAGAAPLAVLGTVTELGEWLRANG